jgi:3-hydroxyisobutyrate dehydrogenase
MDSVSPRVALLGLGIMGTGMARNLLGAGLPLTVWNRSAEKARALGEAGAVVAGDPQQAVAGADLVVTMLLDVDAVAEVMRRAAPGLGAGTIWVQTSTVGVDGASRLADLARDLGLSYVDAPVLGTKKPAADGALVVLASGPEDVRDRCARVFEAIGSRTLWVGPAGAGSRLKLVANGWVLAVLEGVAESLTLARGLGLDPALFFEAIAGGAMDAPYVKLKGQAMLAEQFDPSFTVDGAAKDADLILSAAESSGVWMDVVRVARHRLREAAQAGYGGADMAAIAMANRQRAVSPQSRR